jgi:hypothetical protein
MSAYKRFRVLTPNGLLSGDTFVMAARQPSHVATGCLVMVDEQTGTALTVHATRLIPEEAPELPPEHKIGNNVCLTCGRVRGVVADQVACPFHGDAPCDMQAAAVHSVG